MWSPDICLCISDTCWEERRCIYLEATLHIELWAFVSLLVKSDSEWFISSGGVLKWQPCLLGLGNAAVLPRL